MARLARVSLYPIKSLDPTTVPGAEVGESGALDGDRRYAILDAEGEYVNGKRTPAVHRLRTSFDRVANEVVVRRQGGPEARRFDLDADRDRLEAYLSEHFGLDAQLVDADGGSYPDDTDLAGPTVISTATIETVASWYPGLTTENVRRRFRANLEVDGVPAFWEDRLVGDRDHGVAFAVGDVTFTGVNPCQRCVVPSRDPYTGEEMPEFRPTFIERREATLPDWVDTTRFDHYFRLMVNTTVSPAERGGEVRVGDEVQIVGEERL
ncbi:MOSC domain-containing protein [Halococcus sp. IIIV-5B]|uniref:MOSC domain-containing protein n=1 Tax=Halococcus sp. IIIV-5B TaxID=2321230 RepID=UPI000E731BFC|nr:MOSC N-terminal beta barrel domain-containing protein [Halococcus sp. IIIV-5B]RJS99654.1 MOSC domain-containing protein [Halococcus sp. IIIV-5B]